MAIPAAKQPAQSTELRTDRTVRGWFGIQDGIITGRHRDGWEKMTTASAPGDHEGRARLILSEPPPTHWQKP